MVCGANLKLVRITWHCRLPDLILLAAVEIQVILLELEFALTSIALILCYPPTNTDDIGLTT